MKLEKSILGLSLAAFLTLTGCTNGGLTNAISGTAFDGKISGATVCVDVNANESCDAGEDSTTTDINGNFTLATAQKGDLLLVGGTDIGTGKAFTGSLKAPEGSAVVSPLTTMVAAMVDDTTDAAAAEALLKTALGIPATVALTSFDPFADSAAENAKEVLAVQAEIQTIVHASSSAIAGAMDETTASTNIATAMKKVTKNLAATIKTAAALNSTGVVPLQSTLVRTAMDAAADEVLANDENAKAAVKAVSGSIALQSVAYAAVTKTKVTNSTAGSLFDSFNAGMVVANDTLETSVKATTKEIKDIKDGIITDKTEAEAINASVTIAENATAAAEEATTAAATVVAAAKSDIIAECEAAGNMMVDGVCTAPTVTATGALVY